MSGTGAEQARIAALEAGLVQTRSHLATLQQECDRRQSEARYRQIFENAPISIMLINAQGYVMEANQASEQLFRTTVSS